jgi:hypothetical protein
MGRGTNWKELDLIPKTVLDPIDRGISSERQECLGAARPRQGPGRTTSIQLRSGHRRDQSSSLEKFLGTRHRLPVHCKSRENDSATHRRTYQSQDRIEVRRDVFGRLPRLRCVLDCSGRAT